MSVFNELRHRFTDISTTIIRPIIRGGQRLGKEASQVFLYHYRPLRTLLANNEASSQHNEVQVTRQGLIGFSFLAPVAWLSALGVSVLLESKLTAVYTWFSAMEWLLTPSEFGATLLIGPDQRGWWQRHLLGGLGHITGAGVAFFLAAVTRVFQVIKYSAYSFVTSFSFLTNLGLSEQSQFEYINHFKNQNVHWFKRYVFASPGTVVGGLAGVLSLATIVAYKGVQHTFRSMLSLSGAYLNIAFQAVIAEGMANDNRALRYKLVGGLGYVFATVAVLPISLIIFSARKTPMALAYSVGLLFSPLVLAVKSIAAWRGRQAQTQGRGDNTIVKFKRIKNSLTAWGRLPQGEQIDSEHQRSSTALMVKAITLDTKSPTERILTTLRNAYIAQYPQEYMLLNQSHPEFF